MLCSVYLGPTPGAWRDAVRAHADWLGLEITADTRYLESGVALELAWLHPGISYAPYHARQNGEWLIITSFGDVPFEVAPAHDGRSIEQAALARRDNLATIAVCQTGNELIAVVPPASPHRLLFARAAGGFVLADDLRLFRRITPARVDDRGLFALAQYGAIPAPLTLFHEVRRVPNGYALRLDVASGSPTLVPLEVVDLATHPGPVGAAEAPSFLEARLVEVLRGVPEPTTLYFSGGVDSGLLAAQLARLGRREVQLVNYSFGREDRESQLAERMAARLGFRLQVIPHDPALADEMIDRLGRDYTFPFGDISVVPANLLVRRAAAVTPRGGTALEGTGADGAFAFGAMYPWWKSVYTLPRILRGALGGVYGASGLWRTDSRVTQGLRFVRKSVQMPLTHAVVAQHALEGIAFRSTPELREAVVETARTFIEHRTTDAEPMERLSVFDLTWACVGRMTPKTFDPLRQAGVAPRYPYLEPPMLAAAAALSWPIKCAGGEPKAPLKTLLARDVPSAWVYRRKHGFTPPEQEILSSPAVQERLHTMVLAPGGPFAGLCRADRIRTMVGLVARGAVGTGVYDLLWVLLFTTVWLDQVPAGPGRQCGSPLPAAPEAVHR